MNSRLYSRLAWNDVRAFISGRSELSIYGPSFCEWGPLGVWAADIVQVVTVGISNIYRQLFLNGRLYSCRLLC